MEFEESGRPNKSALKREAKQVEETANQATEQAEDLLARLELSGRVRDELELASRTQGHGSRKRQIKHLAGLLRKSPEDLEQIQAFLDGVSDRHLAEQEQFHQVEQWRDRLCDPAQMEAALQELRSLCPQLDLAQLAKLARMAGNGDKGAARKVFRALRTVADYLE